MTCPVILRRFIKRTIQSPLEMRRIDATGYAADIGILLCIWRRPLWILRPPVKTKIRPTHCFNVTFLEFIGGESKPTEFVHAVGYWD